MGAGRVRVVRAEWTKLRSVSSSLWLLLACAVSMVLVGALTVGAVDTSRCPTPAECFEDTTELSLTGVRVGQVAVVLLAVFLIGGEYATGMVRTTLTARPGRVDFVFGKAVVVAGTVAVTGAIGVAGSLWAGRLILPGNGFTAENGHPALSVTDGPTLRAAFGTVLYLVLIALLALGLGAALRDSAGAAVVTLTVLFIVPVITRLVADPDWQDRLERYAPMSAGLSIQATRDLAHLPISPWAGLGVTAVWAAASLLAGTLRVVRRDP